MAGLVTGQELPCHLLCVGSPDSVDFVSLWLCWGNLTAEQQTDPEEISGKRFKKPVLCWRAGDIGDNLTPGGNATDVKNAFWGIDPNDEDTYIEAKNTLLPLLIPAINIMWMGSIMILRIMEH